jgi:predicted nucleotidyltransferase
MSIALPSLEPSLMHERETSRRSGSRDVYFSADVETDGPIPGPFSMLSFALVYAGKFDGRTFVRPKSYKQIFYRELRPISDNYQPEALKVNGIDRNALLKKGNDPGEAMTEAAAWVMRLSSGGSPVLVAYPLSFDWSRLYWYFTMFSREASPFNHSRCLDIKTAFAIKASVPISKAGRSRVFEMLRPARVHTHHAIHDAIEQAVIFANVFEWSGLNAAFLDVRREESANRLQMLRNRLLQSETLCVGKACVYVTGSFGRGEASKHSDLDIFMVGQGMGGKRALSRLDEILVKAELIEATRDMGFPPFSGDGQYLVHHTIRELVEMLGDPNDDAMNTFTERLLLLLESVPLVGSQQYDDAISGVINEYWRDFAEIVQSSTLPF